MVKVNSDKLHLDLKNCEYLTSSYGHGVVVTDIGFSESRDLQARAMLATS